MIDLQYYLIVTIHKKYGFNTTHKKPLLVWKINPPEIKKEIMNLEVGIENQLHIYFEFTKSMYHLMDCIMGKIEFVEIKIKLKHMEINIIKKEKITQG